MCNPTSALSIGHGKLTTYGSVAAVAACTSVESVNTRSHQRDVPSSTPHQPEHAARPSAVASMLAMRARRLRLAPSALETRAEAAVPTRPRKAGTYIRKAAKEARVGARGGGVAACPAPSHAKSRTPGAKHHQAWASMNCCEVLSLAASGRALTKAVNGIVHEGEGVEAQPHGRNLRRTTASAGNLGLAPTLNWHCTALHTPGSARPRSCPAQPAAP